MEPSIVFFDDHCILCSRSVRFIFRNDPKEKYRFAPVDSPVYREIAGAAAVKDDEIGSVVLYHRKKIYTRSTAALLIASRLRFPWPLLSMFLVIPSFIRDAVYAYVARNRYRWFGRLDNCFLPEGGIRDRFLTGPRS